MAPVDRGVIGKVRADNSHALRKLDVSSRIAENLGNERGQADLEVSVVHDESVLGLLVLIVATVLVEMLCVPASMLVIAFAGVLG